MNYIEKTKSDGENIIKMFNLSIWVYLPIIFNIIIGLLLIILASFIVDFIPLEQVKVLSVDDATKIIRFIGIVLFFKSSYTLLIYKYLDMGLTDRRVVYKKGIISRDTHEIRLDAAESAFIEQSILGRLLGYGTVIITGRGESIASFKDIDNPIKVKVEIESAINKYRRK